MKSAKIVGVFLAGFTALLALISLASHIYFGIQERNEQARLETSYSQSIFTPEEVQEDIAYLRSLLRRVHPPAIPSFSLGEVDTSLENLTKTISEPLTHIEAYTAIAPIVNLLNDEHTMVFPAEKDVRRIYESGLRLFPYDVEFIGEELYIAGSPAQESAIPAGTEITSINGISTEDLHRTLIKFFSGTSDAQKAFYAQQNFRESLFMIFGIGDRIDLEVIGSERGESYQVSMTGRVFQEPTEQPFHFETIAADTILFSYNSFEDEFDNFSSFLEEMFSTAQEQGTQRLIIDIRANQGGASAFGDEILDYLTDEPFEQFSRVEVTNTEEVRHEFIGYVPAFIRWLPIEYFHPMLSPLWKGDLGDASVFAFDRITPGDNPLRFTGDVYLLIGPGTMSSASLFAATLASHEIATLIGEPTGGYATFYGNIVDLYLPNTGLKVWMPTSVIYGNGTGPIVPDHIVLRTQKDIAQQRDPVLETARALIQPR